MDTHLPHSSINLKSKNFYTVRYPVENKLMYIGVTHNTANVSERACFALDQTKKNELKDILRQKLSIDALVIITTCNRTEIYFESETTTPYEVRELFINYMAGFHQVKLSRKVFMILNGSIYTANHLLRVANGLNSAVVGDKQIIHQVKGSYLEALNNGTHGSLLERAFQAVFRSHKRIAVESHYRQGSTSTAYSALKMMEEYFGKDGMQHKKMLIIGAGEIAGDVLRYLPKFLIKDISIANRTLEKALLLAKRFQINTYEWEHVVQNNFSSFDVIITAVSNCKDLINSVENHEKNQLWIDLAMPSNVNSKIANQHHKIYNLDDISEQVSSINEEQLKAIPVVNQIIEEELNVFIHWLKDRKVRTFLKWYKERTKRDVLNSISAGSSTIRNEVLQQLVNNRIDKLVRNKAKMFKALT
ncbi:MAG: glutamyl-tRNA reductase [Bacteroidota bacterium]